MRKFIAAIALVLMLSLPASADCISVAEAVQKMQTTSTYVAHEVLNADATKAAAEIYRSIPPESEDDFDTAILFELKKSEGAIFIGKHGEVCEHLKFTADDWITFKRSVIGQPV